MGQSLLQLLPLSLFCLKKADALTGVFRSMIEHLWVCAHSERHSTSHLSESFFEGWLLALRNGFEWTKGRLPISHTVALPEKLLFRNWL